MYAPQDGLLQHLIRKEAATTARDADRRETFTTYDDGAATHLAA